MFFVASQDLIVPVCVVKVLLTAKVPVTSLTTKCAFKVASGGFAILYLNPELLILISLTAPISLVNARSLEEEPPMVVTPTVGSVEYPLPELAANTFAYKGEAPPVLSIVNVALDPRPEYVPLTSL